MSVNMDESTAGAGDVGSPAPQDDNDNTSTTALIATAMTTTALTNSNQEDHHVSTTSSSLNRDMLMNELESSYVQIRSERDSVREAHAQQSRHVSSLQSDVAALQLRASQSDGALHEVRRTADSERARRVAGEASLVHSEERVSRLSVEGDSLREEIARLTKRNASLVKDVSDLTLTQHAAVASSVPSTFATERLSKQLESVTAHADWLESELATKHAELSHSRVEHSKDMTTCRTELEQSNSDQASLQAKLTSSLRDTQQLTHDLEQAHTKIRQSRLDHADLQRTSQEELQAEKRVAALLQDKCGRLEERSEDALRTTEDLRRAATAADDRHMQELGRLENEMEELIHKQNNDIEDLTLKYDHMTMLRNKAEDNFTNLQAQQDRKRQRVEQLTDNATPLSSLLLTTPASLTDLYDKLAETEDNLQASQKEKERLELYMQKICSELEGNAPKIRLQRQEYETALRDRDDSVSRLHEAVRDAQDARGELEDVVKELEFVSKENGTLRTENVDLATQVQRLLKSRMGEGDDHDHDNNLITFDNITQLQSNNQELLREKHQLTDTVTSLQNELDQTSLKQSLEAAEEELEELREERNRQITLVKGIVQQRDLYRALLSNEDKTVDQDVLLLTQGNDNTVNASDTQLTTKLHADVQTLTNTNASLQERVTRLDAHSQSLTDSVDKLNDELNSAHATVARTQAESTYHVERCGRLEDTVSRHEQQITCLEKERLELQNVQSKLETVLAENRAELLQHEHRTRQATAKLGLTQTQYDTACAAEKRLTEENHSLRNDMTRQGTLLESVRRIESSLSARSAQDTARLEEELQQNKDALEVRRVTHQSELEGLHHKIAGLETDVQSLHTSRDKAVTDSVKAKDVSLDLQAQVKLLEGQCDLTEGELKEARDKLSALTEGGKEYDELRDEVASLKETVVTMKTDLETNRQRLVNFQGIAKKSEDALTELTIVTEKFKEDKRLELEQLRSDLKKQTQNAEARQTALADLTNDLAKQRGEQEESERLLKSQLATSNESVKDLQSDTASKQTQIEVLTSQLQQSQAANDTSQQNYERELENHATARTELRNVKDEFETESQRRRKAEGECEELKAELESKKKEWEEERERLQVSVTDIEKRLAESKTQNDLLHSQMAALSDTVEKFQSQRIESAATADDTTATTDEQQRSQLETSVSELREMVRFMKSERDLVDAQLEALKRTAERERATAAVARRSLDEARAELSRGVAAATDTNTSNKENDDTQQKRQTEQQLSLLRDSNTLLREDSERTRAKLARTQEELKIVETSLRPAETRIKELEVDVAAKEAEKTSLNREVDAWKGRMQNFVSKFQMIDPEEHAKALASLDGLKQDCDKLKALKEQADKDGAGAKAIVSRLNRDVSSQKAQLKAVTDRLAKVQTEKEALVKSTSETTKKESEKLKASVKTLEKELEAKKSELTTTRQRVDNLTKMLRKYQETVKTLQQKAKVNSEQQEAAAKAKKQTMASQNNNNKNTTTTTPTATAPTPVTKTGPAHTAAATAAAVVPASKKEVESTIATTTAAKTTAKVDGTAASVPNVEIPSGGFKFAASVDQGAKAGKQTNDKSNIVTSASAVVDNTSNEVARAVGEKSSSDLASAQETAKTTKKIKLNKGSDTTTTSTTTKVVMTEQSDTLGQVKHTPTKKSLGNLKEKLMERKRKLQELAAIKKAEEEKAAALGSSSSSTIADTTPNKRKQEEPTSVSSPLPKMTTTTFGNTPTKSNVPSITSLGTSTAAVGKTVPSASTFTTPSKKLNKPATSSVFGSATLSTSAPAFKLGSAPTTTFGSGAAPTFGSRMVTKSSSTTDSSSSSGFGNTFLNLKPPGSSSSSGPLTFGSSSTFKIPIPSKPSSGASPFGGTFGRSTSGSNATTSVFSTTTATPLFGSSKKRTASTKDDDDNGAAVTAGNNNKQARVEEKEEGEANDPSSA